MLSDVQGMAINRRSAIACLTATHLIIHCVRISANNSGAIRNPALFTSSSITGCNDSSSPSCLARSKTPRIPVTFNPRDLATFLPSRSSRSVQSALSSMARAIASASPRSSDCFKSRVRGSLLTSRLRIQPDEIASRIV
jgi:hypothetical protein